MGKVERLGVDETGFKGALSNVLLGWGRGYYIYLVVFINVFMYIV